MRAIVLCAGRGERLRPLTDHTPKPLLEVQGRRLVDWHLAALARAGVSQVVINTAWLEPMFPAALGDGSAHGLSILWSHEARDHGGALETAGGIAAALHWLGDCFWVVAGDVFLPGFEFHESDASQFAAGDELARLWLVPNAPHHPQGDYGVDERGRASADLRPRRTWASVGLFRRALFEGVVPGRRLALRPLLDQAAAAGRLGAVAWDGEWTDVGTPERLAAARRGAEVMR